MRHAKIAVQLLIIVLFSTAFAQISKKVECIESPLDVFILADSNVDDIGILEDKLIATIRYIVNISTYRDVRYALITFHNRPTLISSFSSRFAQNSNKIIEFIREFPRENRTEVSPAKALRLASEQFNFNGRLSAKKILFLAYNGQSTDLIAETIEARNGLDEAKVEIFVIASPKAAIDVLTGYTKHRNRILSLDIDRNVFFDEINTAIESCVLFQPFNRKAVARGVQSKTADDTIFPCKTNKIDLIFTLDTSGSVYGSFSQERKLLEQIIETLNPSSFTDGSIQVGIIHFSSLPHIALRLELNRSAESIIESVRKIDFTGLESGIVRALYLSLAELRRSRRSDAMQVIILISDGHGQDFWNIAQHAGRKIQRENVEVFAVTTSSDYNIDELALYTSNKGRIFTGERFSDFITNVIPLFNSCLVANRTRLESDLPKDIPKSPPADEFLNQLNDVGNGANKLAVISNKESKSPNELEQKTIQDNFSVNKAFENSSLPNPEVNSSLSSMDNKIANLAAVFGFSAYNGSQLDDPLPNDDEFDNESCKVDLIFIIDRSMSVESDFNNQLNFAKRIVEKLSDLNERVRVSVISFAREARIDLDFDAVETKEEILKRLASIQHTGGETSAATAINLAIGTVKSKRRFDARLIVIHISDGNSQDEWNRVVKTADDLQSLQHSVVFAVTFSKKYSFVELEAYAGDKWHVFTSEKANDLLDNISENLLKCKNGKKLNIEIPVMKSKEISACNDLIDMIIVLDKSTSMQEDFLAAKTLAEEVINSAQSDDYFSRIHLSIISFNDRANVEKDLEKGKTRNEINEILQQIEHTGGETSAVSGIKAAISQIQHSHRIGSRLIVILFSDGGSKDPWDLVANTAKELHSHSPEVFAVSITNRYIKKELLLYANDSKRILANMNGRSALLIETIGLYSCEQNEKDEIVKEEEPIIEEKIIDLQHTTGSPIMNDEVISSTIIKPEITTQQPATTSSDECKIDLIYAIDTSESVEEVFNEEISLAIDLISRIPKSDLSTKIRVAAISFYNRSKIEFGFDQIADQNQIMNAIQSVKHTGGGTSLVSGINLAVDEFEKKGRKDARYVVILISDGKSQDLWKDLLSTADRLHSINASVYAVSASPVYFFRELEVYAGSKSSVFVGNNKNRFINEVEKSFKRCGVLSTQSSETTKKNVAFDNRHTSFLSHGTTILKISPTTRPLKGLGSNNCSNGQVDIAILIDTSTSIKSDFLAEKNFVVDFIKYLPENDFETKYSIALVQFADVAKLLVGFGRNKTRSAVLDEISSITNTGGQTSLANGVSELLSEIVRGRRSNARLIVVLVSDGNSQDLWSVTQVTSKKLHETGAETYAVTLSAAYYLDELAEYTGHEQRVYIGNRVDKFFQEVGSSITDCDGGKIIPITQSTLVESKVTSNNRRILFATSTIPSYLKIKNGDDSATEFVRDEKPIKQSLDEVVKSYKSCNYSKMDLEIILDASTSRQEVFEHQRELALSLIERLPIAADETHVAVGINSFTQVPTLRQTLGLGRDKQMVRRAIEDIKYRGGSTLTARAVVLSIQDLKRGRRPDAIQVVVLMNDGMSQDPWSEVLIASEQLKNTGAERFGVALGDKIDLRELRRYIGDENRIYRDGSTERFLSDVVGLLTGNKSCNLTAPPVISEPAEEKCKPQKLDIVIVFDNADETKGLTDSAVIANRYLLLDVLGSLPSDGERIKISLISFANDPKLIVGLNDDQTREVVFNKMESVQAQSGKPEYAKAINFALREYEKAHRADARGLLLIVGDGKSEDNANDRRSAAQHIKMQTGLVCYAVDSSKSMDVESLTEYTGSPQRVYNYDRNAEFANTILRESKSPECDEIKKNVKQPIRQSTSKIVTIPRIEQKLKDVSFADEKTLKFNDNEKLISTNAPKKGPKSSANQIGGSSNNNVNNDKIVTKKTPKNQPALNKKIGEIYFTTKPFITGGYKPLTASPLGCKVDLVIILDSSGSVEETFVREKELSAGIIERLNIGNDATKVAIIKFAAKEKVRTVWSFNQSQSRIDVMNALRSVAFTNGITAIHSALLQAIIELTSTRGARPGQATPVCVIFTDGFGEKDTTEAATLLRAVVPNIFSIAINHQYAINRPELARIAGTPERVFTDSNIGDFYEMFEKLSKRC